MENMKYNFKYFGGLTFLYGVIFVFCLYRNLTGITFPLYVIATIVFSVLFIKREPFSFTGNSTLIQGVTGSNPILPKGTLKLGIVKYFIGMLLLGISTFMTTNHFFHFFNWLGIILLFMAAMIHQFYEDKEWKCPIYIKNFCKLFGTSVVNLASPVAHMIHFLKEDGSNELENDTKKKKILRIAIGLLFAFLLALFVVPLLMFSDQIFAEVLRNVFRHINIWHILGITFTFSLGTIPFYAFFVALSKRNLYGSRKEEIEKKY